MYNLSYVHGFNIHQKKAKINHHKILDEIYKRYEAWRKNVEALSSENRKELKRKVSLLNDYRNYIDSISGYFKPQDKLESSVIEEFLYLLFKDTPNIKNDLSNGLLFMGQAATYLDLSFAPRNLKDFVNNPGVYVNKKKQDFAISKKVSCLFESNKKQEKIDLIVPAVVIECKAYIPKTMFDQSAYEAQRLKEGNPFALYVIIAEQNALSNDVNLKNTKVDEIFILRKQKRSKKKNPIAFGVIEDLYNLVKEYLKMDWFDNREATQRGRLIRR